MVIISLLHNKHTSCLHEHFNLYLLQEKHVFNQRTLEMILLHYGESEWFSLQVSENSNQIPWRFKGEAVMSRWCPGGYLGLGDLFIIPSKGGGSFPGDLHLNQPLLPDEVICPTTIWPLVDMIWRLSKKISESLIHWADMRKVEVRMSARVFQNLIYSFSWI